MKNDVIWFQQQLTARKILMQNALHIIFSDSK